jgi:cell division protease FtsH
VLPADGQGPLLPGVSETSQRTQELVDDEVRRIVDTAHHETTETLTRYRSNLDALVTELMAHETLDQIAAYRAAGLPTSLAAQAEAAAPSPAATLLTAADADEAAAAAGNGQPPTE